MRRPCLTLVLAGAFLSSPAEGQGARGVTADPVAGSAADGGQGVPEPSSGIEESEKKWLAPLKSAPAPGTRQVPWVHFVHLYTGDVLPVFGERVGKRSFAHLMRCRATGQTGELDPRLARLMLAAAKALDGTVVELLSGYRSEKFNEQLRKKGRGVGSESLHCRGLAVDWRLQAVPLPRLVAWLRREHRGGLGMYPELNFVHTDFGPERRWRGR